ncbi:MAG: DUF481 domain-containing protein [Candidatus Omnitrophota bacterium]|jgi:putative salt-induced outer membrane protein YdiY
MTKFRPLLVIPGLALLLTVIPGLNSFADEWKREISLGYNQANGNTDSAQLNLNGAIKYLMTEAEFSSSMDIYYGETDNNMDTQKWLSLTRYYYNFGEKKVWFNSYQLEVMHDFFADVDYRVTPAVGLGHWFSKEEDWTSMLEGLLGYEITEYRTPGKDQDEGAVFIAHTFMKKKVLEKAFVSEDLSLIPSLEGNGFRVKSETAFINPISASVDLTIKYIVDFNSEPSEDKKKTDTLFVTALKYSF